MRDLLMKVVPSFVGGMLVLWGIQEKNRFLEGERVEEITPPSLSRGQLALKEIGQPITNFVIHRTSYSVGYDPRHRNPSWVHEHLTQQQLEGGETKALFKISEEELIPAHLRAKLDDFRQGTWERAHLCPPADHRFSRKALSETFYISNIAPQARKFNQGIWRKLEKQVRDWTKEYESLDVFTGPVYLPKQGEKQLRISLLGSSGVAIPSHFYKVILAKGSTGYESFAYLLPNEAISRTAPLEEYKTSLETVEKAAGILFCPELEGRIDKKSGGKSEPHLTQKYSESIAEAVEKIRH